MGRGKGHDSKEQAKVLVKKQDSLKKYGSKTQKKKNMKNTIKNLKTNIRKE